MFFSPGNTANFLLFKKFTSSVADIKSVPTPRFILLYTQVLPHAVFSCSRRESQVQGEESYFYLFFQSSSLGMKQKIWGGSQNISPHLMPTKNSELKQGEGDLEKCFDSAKSTKTRKCTEGLIPSVWNSRGVLGRHVSKHMEFSLWESSREV